MAQIYHFDNKGGVFFDNSGSTFIFDPWKEAEKPSEPSSAAETADAETSDPRQEGSADQEASDSRQEGSADASAGAGTEGTACHTADVKADASADSSSFENRQEAANEGNIVQLTNRQVIILMASLMGISLSPTDTNHSELSRLLSRITGRSPQSLRQSIMSYARDGLDKAGAKRDAQQVASLIEHFCPDIAERIRCDAED